MLFHTQSGNDFFDELKKLDANSPLVGSAGTPQYDFKSDLLNYRTIAWGDLTDQNAVIEEVAPGLYKEVSSRHTVLLMAELNTLSKRTDLSNTAMKKQALTFLNAHLPKIGNNQEIKLILEELKKPQFNFLRVQRHSWFDRFRLFIFKPSVEARAWQTKTWQNLVLSLKNQAHSNTKNWREVQGAYLENWYKALPQTDALKLAYPDYVSASDNLYRAQIRHDNAGLMSAHGAGHYAMAYEFSEAHNDLWEAKTRYNEKRQALNGLAVGNARTTKIDTIVDSEAKVVQPLMDTHRSNFALLTRNWAFGKTKLTESHKKMDEVAKDTPHNRLYSCRLIKR